MDADGKADGKEQRLFLQMGRIHDKIGKQNPHGKRRGYKDFCVKQEGLRNG